MRDDVPRNENGWPLLGPCAMTDIQLVKEAYGWYHTAKNAYNQNVGLTEWQKYTTELVRRGLMTQEQADGFARPEELEWLRPHLSPPSVGRTGMIARFLSWLRGA